MIDSNATTAVGPARSTLADLAGVPGKAELIGGRIVPLMPTGYRPNLVAGRIFRSLADHVDATGQGVAFTDDMGFAVPELASGRESFSPDVASYPGPPPADEMDYVSGPPSFAVEVRSKGDYGPAAERAMAAKRADYFEAGARVVWDVDPLASAVHVYRADNPLLPETRILGRHPGADAEPAILGWRVDLGWIFG